MVILARVGGDDGEGGDGSIGVEDRQLAPQRRQGRQQHQSGVPQSLPSCTDPPDSLQIEGSPPPISSPFLFSSASLPFWLRSSVVSVLISLISDTGLRTRLLIILIFASWRTSLWACPWSSATVSLVSHCLQATRIFSLHSLAAAGDVRKSLIMCPRTEFWGS
jgi:hypothetical protein